MDQLLPHMSIQWILARCAALMAFYTGPAAYMLRLCCGIYLHRHSVPDEVTCLAGRGACEVADPGRTRRSRALLEPQSEDCSCEIFARRGAAQGRRIQDKSQESKAASECLHAVDTERTMGQACR